MSITWPLLDSGESTGAFCSRPATPDTKRVHGLLRMVRQEQVIAGTWWLKAAAGRQCQQRKDHRCYGKNDRCYCKYNPCDPLQRQRRVFLGLAACICASATRRMRNRISNRLMPELPYFTTSSKSFAETTRNCAARPEDLQRDRDRWHAAYEAAQRQLPAPPQPDAEWATR
jgi:hypothetical protein